MTDNPSTPFFIGPAEKEVLEALRTRASENPVNMEGLIERLQVPYHKRRHKQQMNNQTVELLFGWLITFSIEINHPKGTMRHMSMSSPNQNRVPRPQAVWMAAEALGFVVTDTNTEEPPPGAYIWLEDLEGHGRAVNVVQSVDLSSVPAEV